MLHCVQTVGNTNYNPSDHTDVNMDRVNRECFDVMNAWSESGQSDNDDCFVINVTTIN